VKATRDLSTAILTYKETAGRTEVVQKKDRIMPIDHLVDKRPEEARKPLGSLRKDLVYRTALVSLKPTPDCHIKLCKMTGGG